MQKLARPRESQAELKLKLNSAQQVSRISSFIARQVKISQTNGVVIGMSGGIDSAVTASLCVSAVGAKRVLGVLLFEDVARKTQDFLDAKKMADQLRIKTIDISITDAVEATVNSLKARGCKISRLTLANIKARTRMVILYALANERRLLVAGTGDRSESLVGYFTKYGDGGVDILPIGHLYKTEVRSLGTYLRIPYEIVSKPSSPNLWPGHKASEELPADYDVLDKVLTLLFDSKMTFQQIKKQTGVSEQLMRDVIKLNKGSIHKRLLPPLME